MLFENSLFNQIDLILIALDSEGRFLSLNSVAGRLFHSEGSSLVGKSFQTVLDEQSVAKAGQMIALTLQDGSVKNWELNHRQADSDPVLVSYTTCVLRDENQHILGIGAVGSDLNPKLNLTTRLAAANQDLEGALLQLEKTHAELKSTQAQLLQSEKMRALGQMVAGVAHEINNPLGFARNNFVYLNEKVPGLQSLYSQYEDLKNNAPAEKLRAIRLLEQKVGIEYLWDDLKDAIREGLEGIDRIRDIVLSLRNFSRLDEAELKEVDLNEGLRSTLRLLKPLCKHDIRIEESYGAIPGFVCRPGELNQVFLNLLTNAIQSIEEAGWIKVDTRSRAGKIWIRIADSGKGMDEQVLARLGEPFFTTKPPGTGVGLGLAVSFSIVQRHKGKIQFKSSPGEGTVATVELPVP